MKADINEIRLALWEVRPMPKRDWEDGFQRDTNPDKEIALWLRLARAYQTVVARQTLTRAEKMDYYRVLLACLNSPREHVLKTVDLQTISTEQAESVIQVMYGDGTSSASLSGFSIN
jgi:hypothetical protein